MQAYPTGNAASETTERKSENYHQEMKNVIPLSNDTRRYFLFPQIVTERKRSWKGRKNILEGSHCNSPGAPGLGPLQGRLGRCLHRILSLQTGKLGVLLGREGPDCRRASPRVQVLSESVYITCALVPSAQASHWPRGGEIDLTSCGQSHIGRQCGPGGMNTLGLLL